MRTPAEEAEYQRLGTQLGLFNSAPVAADPGYGLLGFSGRTAANVLPGALEKIMQPMAAIAGGGREDLSATDVQMPNFFNVRAPQGVGEHVVAGAGELAEYLPGILMTEGAAASGLMKAGLAPRASKIIGSGIGFGLPMTPQGAETAGIQGGVGALQTAAMDWGWRGKAAAGLLGGAAGFYEGAKGPNGSLEQGAIYGALNLLGPTVLDPLVNKLTGYKPQAQGGGEPIPGQPFEPPKTTLPGGAGVMNEAFQQMNPAQKQAYIDATMGRSGPAPYIGPEPPRAGFFGDFSQNPGNAPLIRNPIPPLSGTFEGGARTPREGANLFPVPDLSTTQGTGIDFTYGRQLDPYDAFARLQTPPIIGHNELFPAPQPRLFDPRTRVSETTVSGTDLYGGQLGVFDVTQGLERRPSGAVLSPNESAARTQFEAQRQLTQPPTQSRTPIPSGKQPHTKIPSGLTKLLGDDVGWTPPGSPLKEGFTRDAFALGRKFKSEADVKRARKMAEEYRKASIAISDSATTPEQLAQAQEYASRGQYFEEAAEYATGGNPAKTATFLRHDPEYVPSVPSAEWHAMKAAGIDSPIPKPDEEIIHWSEDGFPLDTKVTKVEGNMVHYVEDNMLTGEKSTKVASLQEFDRLQKHPKDRAVVEAATKPIEQKAPPPPPPKTEPVKPAAAKAASVSPTPAKAKPTGPATQVRVRGRFGMETANVIARDGNALTVEIDDPIFGKRTTSVLESDTQPVASLQVKVEGGGTVPFKDVESVKLHGGEGARGSAQRGESEADLLGSVMEGSGPGAARKTLPGKEKEVLTLEEGLKLLPPEAATIIGSIIQRMKVAAGQDIDTSLAKRMVGAKGGMYETSGRVALNLQWINGIVQHWPKMSEQSRAKALMRVAALFGHEVSHVAHKFAEKSNLLIDGVPITKAVMEKVDAMSQSQREYVARQILEAKGEISPSKGVVAYLSGDIDQVYGWYKRHRPNLTREGAKELAAGEVLAEIGAIELIKRTEVKGLPEKFREAVDAFKAVLVRVIGYFRGKNETAAVAGLQDLQNIAGKMYDHLQAGDTVSLHKAFPGSTQWHQPPPVSPFSSGTPPPVAVEVATPFLKQELSRLGIRAAVGATAGGLIGPIAAPNQVSTAEGIILGGVLGMFGPAVAKKLLSGNLAAEVKAAVGASKGNPVKTLAYIMGGGKSLRDLGAEARFGLTAESSAASKFVRLLESEFNLNLDPKLKALLEEGRGMGTVVLATVQDALDKVRWYKPGPAMVEAVGQYFEGKISKDDFVKLLTSPELQNYGNFIIAAREGMTTLTQMFAAGMGKSQFRDHLIETSDKYLGRFYSAYKEGKFNMKAFDKAKADFMAKYKDYSDHTADSIMREMMREVQANRSVFGGRRGNSGQKIDTSTTFRRLATEEEIEGQAIIVGGLEHNPFSLDYKKEKAKLDWMMEHKITENWREWLGEYKNPIERMVYSFQKIYPSAISAKVFDMLDHRVNSNGLKFSYTAKELVSLRSLLADGVQSATDPAEIARLQNQIKELDAYGAVPEGSAYGKLQGKWVDRWTRDEINTYATPFKWMEQPIIRSIAEFNNLIKIGRTAFNPITVIRNIWQMPAFALISKTNAGDVAQAFREIHRIKGDDYRLMLKRHIIGADFVASELSNGPGTLFSGYMDSDVAVKAAKYGVDKVLKFYQQPDQLVRAGAFISARKRFAQRAVESGEFASLQDALVSTKVIDDAVNFTERYTMNYGTVPRIVKIGRQLPFVNLFISYTAEITRILKNLTEDAISPGPNSAGRMHAITVLGAMAAVPAMMVAAAKSNLSERDLADWEKIEKLSPDYNRSRFRIPTHRDEKGKFHYFDISNLIPADSYTQMIKAFTNGDIEAAAAANPIVSLQNTPLLNMFAEQIAGEDLRTGQKIEGYGRVREILKETLPPWMPPGYEGQRLVRAFSENAAGDRGLTNIKSGVEYRPSDIIANYMTGMRFGNVNLASVQKSAIAEAKQEIAVQQQLMRDVTNLNVPTEERARAQAIYNEAVTQIMFKLHSKMGQPQD